MGTCVLIGTDATPVPGRLEVHVEVGLPDEAGRERSFRVHTGGFRREGYLAPDVDLAELARRTPNFTGAEIEGVVKVGRYVGGKGIDRHSQTWKRA